TIPTIGSGFNYTVDFGDGSVQNGVTGSASHTYGQPGVYTVSITGNFPRISFQNSSDRTKIRSVEQWRDIQWQTTSSAFRRCRNLAINAIDAPDLSQVTDRSNLFNTALSLNQSINHWDGSKVPNMSNMFQS